MSLSTRPRLSRLLRAGVTLAVAAPALALTATPVSAAPEAAPVYLPAERAMASTVTFPYTGAEQLFVVPNGVQELEVVAVGAPGGVAGTVDPTTGGGRAARVTTELSVEPGDRLHVRVGGAGLAGGAGWNGGGQPVASTSGAALGGGGATDVRTCGEADTGCSPLASRLVVAAGGGGAGLTTTDGLDDVNLAGGDAGASAPEYAGVRGVSGGGGAASATAGGAGGVDSSYSNPGRGNGNAGTYGAGGSSRFSGSPFRGGGGGGGGVYGGGGGGTGQYYGAGGGGGSSLVPDGGELSLADRTVDPTVTITYDAGPVTQVGVGVADSTLVSSGEDSTTVTATATLADGTPVPGLEVLFDSTDPAHALGPVTDHGDGTYSSTLTGSTTVGVATVTATARGSVREHDVSGTTSVTTEGYELRVEPLNDLVGTGTDEVTVRAKATSAGDVGVDALGVTFTSTDPGHVFGAVTDHGDGTYSATLTGSTTVGAATISASAPGATSFGAEVTTEGYAVTVLPMPKALLATGNDTVPVTATARSTSGRLLAGLDVFFTSTDATQSFAEVADRGDGTYATTLTGSTTTGVASIRAVVKGAGRPETPAVELVTDPYARPAIKATLGSSVPARRGWYRTPVTVTFACTGTLPLTTACPAPLRLAANGRNQVVKRSVTDALGAVGSVSSPGVNIDRTAPKLKVRGARSGAKYPKARRLSCRASDALSGVASCKVVTSKRKSRKGKVVTWRATAVDRAGNTKIAKGKYTIRVKKRR